MASNKKNRNEPCPYRERYEKSGKVFYMRGLFGNQLLCENLNCFHQKSENYNYELEGKFGICKTDGLVTRDEASEIEKKIKAHSY